MFLVFFLHFHAIYAISYIKVSQTFDFYLRRSHVPSPEQQLLGKFCHYKRNYHSKWLFSHLSYHEHVGLPGSRTQLLTLHEEA